MSLCPSEIEKESFHFLRLVAANVWGLSHTHHPWRSVSYHHPCWLKRYCSVASAPHNEGWMTPKVSTAWCFETLTHFVVFGQHFKLRSSNNGFVIVRFCKWISTSLHSIFENHFCSVQHPVTVDWLDRYLLFLWLAKPTRKLTAPWSPLLFACSVQSTRGYIQSALKTGLVRSKDSAKHHTPWPYVYIPTYTYIHERIDTYTYMHAYRRTPNWVNRYTLQSSKIHGTTPQKKGGLEQGVINYE